MSGESGGVLIGGIALLAVAPIIITGAAAIGVAYGAIRVAGYLGKRGMQYATEKKREKELAVNHCSSQLDALYAQMRSTAREQSDACARIANQMSAQFQTMGAEMKQVCESHPSAELLDQKIEASRKFMTQKLDEEASAYRKQILEEGRKNYEKCTQMIDKSNQEKQELVRWADHTAAGVAMQKAAAAEMMRDAEASYRLLDSMARSSRDSSFLNQVQTIFSTLQRARAMMDQALYQSAFSNARTLMRECAIAASAHVQDEIEMDLRVTELQAKVEGLIEEMKAQRFLEFFDETKHNKKKVKVDLNNFSQNKYNAMIEGLEKLSAQLEKDGASGSVYELEKTAEQYESDLEPEARHIMDYSKRIMKGYYDRLYALEIVADFMTQQDYAMDWAMPVGGDASQKLVVHFVQKLTGNTVSVTLDNDIESVDDVAKMAMEVLTFYGTGRPVTEQEKKELRDSLNAALNKAGFGGALTCQGQVNRPSNQVELDQKELVKQLPVEKRI